MEFSDLPEVRTCGIYKVVSPSNRVYVGSSVCIRKRWLNYMRGNCHKQPRLHTSILKYGGHQHKYIILEICTPKNLTERERYWQDFYDVLSKKGLNCVLVSTENAPIKRSQSTRDKLSKANKGKFVSIETRQKIKDHFAKNGHPSKGSNISQERKDQLSKRHKGKGNPMYGKSGDLNPFYGKTHSWETKLKKCQIILNLDSGVFHYGVPDAADTYNKSLLHSIIG